MVSCTVGHPAPPPTGPPVGELWTGTGTTPQHHLFPGTSCSFPCASREQRLSQGCKKAASCLEIPEIIKKDGSVLMPQDKVWPLRYLLSAFLLGRRELLPHSAMGCLNPHGMSTDIGPEEKTWRGEQAPAVAGNCSSLCPHPAEPLQKHAGSGGHPCCRSKRSMASGTQFAYGSMGCLGMPGVCLHHLSLAPALCSPCYPEGEGEQKSQGLGAECMTKVQKSERNEEEPG